MTRTRLPAHLWRLLRLALAVAFQARMSGRLVVVIELKDGVPVGGDVLANLPESVLASDPSLH